VLALLSHYETNTDGGGLRRYNVDDLISVLNHLNLSPLLTFLLVTLLGALRWIGKGIIERIAAIERDLQRLRDEEFQALYEIVQRHTTKIAVVKMKLGMEEDD
jgi:hypothetical protein